MMQLPPLQTASLLSQAAPCFGSGQTQDVAPSGSSSTGSNTATITANDFLQLLVTEMKNQDPTSNTDPNQYINQLVGVNSLEQLVQINQDLGGGSSASNSGSASVPASTQRPGPAEPTISSVTRAPGNLSVTDTGLQGSRLTTAMGAAAHTLAPGAQPGPWGAALNALKAAATQSNPSR